MKILDPGKKDVAALMPSSKGEDMKDKDVKDETPAGAAAPGECTIFFLFQSNFFFHARFFDFRQLINLALTSAWARFAKLVRCFVEVNFSPVSHEAS